MRFNTNNSDSLIEECLYSHPIDNTTGSNCDQTIMLTGFYSKKDYPEKLHRIKFLDLEKDKIPLSDGDVEYVYSNHCLEHIKYPANFFKEIARICCDKATVEIWAPYSFNNNAFMWGHERYVNENTWMGPCIIFPKY